MIKLYLVTESFPYGKGEKSFILPELLELVKYYDITIVSHASEAILKDTMDTTILPQGIKVVNFDIRLSWFQKLKYFIKYFFDKDGLSEIKDILKGRKNLCKKIYQSIGFYGFAMENFRLMKKEHLLLKDEKIIYYTYWYYYYTYSLLRHKKLLPNMHMITRAHGFDLYDEQNIVNRQPFKRIMDKKIDLIFFISEQGKKYYLNRYNMAENKKYVVSRLGTIGIGHSPDLGRRKNGKFRLVSCASVIPLKRVNLIAEALCELQEEIEWVHFGDGDDYGKVTEQVSRLLKDKHNIDYVFKGFVVNEEVLKYYDSHYVDCFILTSSTEGLPVSIQEAMSFGIPIIATAVGGTAELFEDNGILLEANPSRSEVRDAIKKMIHMDGQVYEELRKNSYRIWCERYNAEVNRVKFIKMLEKL